MALTDLTRISTSGIATGTSLSGAILHGDAHFRGTQVGVTSALFDSSDDALEFNDNVKLTFGNDGDLKLYHTGSHSYIQETGSGNLILDTNGFAIRLTFDDSETMLRAIRNQQVELYYDDDKKFETAETGAIVTGILTATSFSGPTLNTSGIATFYDLRVSNNLTVEGTTTTLDTNLIGVDRVEIGANSNTDTAIVGIQSGSADIVNLFDGGTEVLTVTDGGKVGITSTAPQALLDVEGNGTLAKFGSSDSTYETLFIKNNVAGYPAITNESSPDTIELRSTGSVQATIDYNNNDTNKYFRVTTNAQAGDGTELFRVQEDGNVIIGSGGVWSYPKVLNVQGSSGSILSLYNANTTSYAADTTTAIEFKLLTGNTGTTSASCEIRAFKENGTNGNSARALSFYTGVNGGSPTERLRINSDGQLLVGTTSANSNNKIHARLADGSIAASNSNSVILAENSGNAWITIGSGASNYGGILFADSGSADIGQVRYDHNINALQFLTNGGSFSNIRLTIASDGKVGIGGSSTDAMLEVRASNTAHGITLVDTSTSGGSPGFEIISKRQDSNPNRSFCSNIFLGKNRTDQKVTSGIRLGTINFGGNHTDGTEANISYSASIQGIASDDFDSKTDMPTDLLFCTGIAGKDKTGEAAGQSNVGNERLRIQSSGNIQIGTAVNPGNTLRYVDIGNYNTGSSAGSILRLLTVKSDGSSSTSADIVKYKAGGLVINNNESIGTSGFISFGTATGGGSTAERLRITSTGNVIVGDHTAALSTYNSSQPRLSIYRSSGSGGYLELGGNIPNHGHSSGTILFINNNNADAANNDADGKILAMQRVENVTSDTNAGDDMGGDLVFMTKPEAGTLGERLRISSSGDVTVNTGNLIIGTADKGIDFSVNSHLSGKTEEILNHYEVGTYVPTWSTIASSPTTYRNGIDSGTTSNGLSYVRIGKQVTITGGAFWSGGSSINNTRPNMSLPFPARTYSVSGTVGHYSLGETEDIHYLNYGSSTDINFYVQAANSNHDPFGNNSNGEMYFNITYMTYD